MDVKLEQEVSSAVAFFWQTREKQGDAQGVSTGVRDKGDRSAVTGGAQMDEFVNLVRKHVISSGIKASQIFTARRTVDLPGYFRPAKDWDLIIVSDSQLIAAMEFKSQCGPSFGNNFNNRSEEALGNATDIWTAYREGAFKTSERPWLGYFFLLEESPLSTKPVKVGETHFPVFPEFKEASYARRYELLCDRIVRERLYDASCLLLSSRESGRCGEYSEPSPDLTFRNFLASLLGKISEYQQRAAL